MAAAAAAAFMARRLSTLAVRRASPSTILSRYPHPEVFRPAFTARHHWTLAVRRASPSTIPSRYPHPVFRPVRKMATDGSEKSLSLPSDAAKLDEVLDKVNAILAQLKADKDLQSRITRLEVLVVAGGLTLSSVIAFTIFFPSSIYTVQQAQSVTDSRIDKLESDLRRAEETISLLLGASPSSPPPSNPPGAAPSSPPGAAPSTPPGAAPSSPQGAAPSSPPGAAPSSPQGAALV